MRPVLNYRDLRIAVFSHKCDGIAHSAVRRNGQQRLILRDHSIDAMKELRRKIQFLGYRGLIQDS